MIEDRPGFTETLGAAQLAQNAKPDGHTIAQMPITVFRLPHMMKTAFDPMTDFIWVIHLTGYTFGVVVKVLHDAFRKALATKTYEKERETVKRLNLKM